jgi:PhzF family phenazine biosynthesis protein
MAIRIVQVDAFTDRPFGGNPAAVCVLAAAPTEQWMRDIAREMNLSETAYLVPRGNGAGEVSAGGVNAGGVNAGGVNDGYDLRWFTPAVEVDLCGHATVASAHVLWQDGHLPPGQQARFYTRSGLLTADRRGDWIELDFPAKLATAAEPPPALLPALGITHANFVGKNAFDYLVEVDSEETVRRMAPDHSSLRTLPVRGIIVTARGAGSGSNGAFDFVSRFFAPGSGIDEDPVTGSAHTALGPYWAPILGKTEFTAFQASARGGVVKVRLSGDRVLLSGQAVTVMTGELLVA